MNAQTATSEVASNQQDDVGRKYRILFLEDNPDDVELMQHELTEAGLIFTSRQSDKRDEFLKLVTDFKPDVVLADYSLSSFNGMQAYYILRRERVMIPF